MTLSRDDKEARLSVVWWDNEGCCYDIDNTATTVETISLAQFGLQSLKAGEKKVVKGCLELHEWDGTLDTSFHDARVHNLRRGAVMMFDVTYTVRRQHHLWRLGHGIEQDVDKAPSSIECTLLSGFVKCFRQRRKR